MKAISLWQPWATLIALGAKRYETRGWMTNFRGPLLIHAAKRWTAEQKTFMRNHYIARALAARDAELPFGAIICKVWMTGCINTRCVDADEAERNFGDFSDGRWAWKLERVVPFVEPIPWRGAQGFFDVPETTLEPAASAAKGHPQ